MKKKKVLQIIFVLCTGPFAFVGFIVKIIKTSYKVGAVLAQKFMDGI